MSAARDPADRLQRDLAAFLSSVRQPERTAAGAAAIAMTVILHAAASEDTSSDRTLRAPRSVPVDVLGIFRDLAQKLPEEVAPDPLLDLLAIGAGLSARAATWVPRMLATLDDEGPVPSRRLAEWLDKAVDAVVRPKNETELETSRSVADLMVGLARISGSGGERVLDPFAGAGEILAAVVRSSSRDRPPELLGREADRVLAAFARVRLMFSRVHVDVADALGSRAPRPAPPAKPAGRVATRPSERDRATLAPIGDDVAARLTLGLPGGSDADGAIVQVAFSDLEEDGVAVIAVGYGFLARSGADVGIRKELVARGLLEAVVAVGGGAAEGALLVLNRRLGADTPVTFVDATARAAPTVEAYARHADALAAVLDGTPGLVPFALVERSALLSGRVDLHPRAHLSAGVSRPSPGDVAGLLDAIDGVVDLAARTGSEFDRLAAELARGIAEGEGSGPTRAHDGAAPM